MSTPGGTCNCGTTTFRLRLENPFDLSHLGRLSLVITTELPPPLLPFFFKFVRSKNIRGRACAGVYQPDVGEETDKGDCWKG